MKIQQIVLHKKLLDNFKKKSLNSYPEEYMVAILGKQKGSSIHIYLLDEMPINERVNTKTFLKISADQPCEDIVWGTDLKYFGTIHTHPDAPVIPSYIDKQTFIERYNADYDTFEDDIDDMLSDKIMGIMQVNQMKNSVQYNLVFYDIDFQIIPILVSENK